MKQSTFFPEINSPGHNVTIEDLKQFPKPTIIQTEWPGLEQWRRILFENRTTPRSFASESWKTRSDKKFSLGKLRPVAWFVEPTRGCNLQCGFCATRLFPRNEFHFMSEETWISTVDVISKLTPYVRIEFCNAGEPTLNPLFLNFLSYARSKVPYAQLLLYTNGTTLLDGRITYKEMFESGLNVAFVDMYSSLESHMRIAKESGYLILEKDKKTKDSVNVFSYQKNPNIKLIQLSPHPGNWTKQKLRSTGLSTFLNNLDWKSAKHYGLEPVQRPPSRRCQQTTNYANVCWDGEYIFCCFDFMRETAGTLGNVSEGVEGFLKFWFGRYMQDCRNKLWHKDRKSHEKCKKCAFTANRCDIARWGPELLNDYWDGKKWISLEDGK
jgi:organic radical activating enzyme